MLEIWTPEADIVKLVKSLQRESQGVSSGIKISREVVILQAFDESTRKGSGLDMEYDMSHLAVGGNEQIEPAALEKRVIERVFGNLGFENYPMRVFYAESGPLTPISVNPMPLMIYSYFVNVQAKDRNTDWIHRNMREALPELQNSEVVLLSQVYGGSSPQSPNLQKFHMSRIGFGE